MLPIILTAVTYITTLSAQQVTPDIVFHFVIPAPGQSSHSLDVDMDDKYGHQLYTLMCRSPENEVTIRISPTNGAIDLIDENRGLTNASSGGRSCLPADSRNHIHCQDPNFCSVDNQCVVTLTSACPALGDSTTWQMTQYFDVTMSQSPDGGLAVSRCFAFCESHSEEKMVSDVEQGISETAVGLIVAGVVAFAALMIISAVVWKIRGNRNLHLESEEHHKPHHIEYAK